MCKKFISYIIIILGLGIGFSFAQNKILNFSYIDSVATLSFQGNIGGNNYKVEVNTGNMLYIPGNDGNHYHCFEVVGTGYTDTLGEVYFGYKTTSAYICNDGKWRGYAKISAGGWIQYEDSNTPEYRNSFINNTQEASDPGFYYHENHAKGYSAGLGFWNWSVVKTAFHPIKQVIKNIDTNHSLINISQNKISNGKDPANMQLIFKDDSNRVISPLFLDYIEFSTGEDNIFVRNNDSGLFFTGMQYQISNKTITPTTKIPVYSILANSGIFEVNIGFDDESKTLQGNTTFLAPVHYDLSLQDKDGDSKLLISNTENGFITQNNDYPSIVSNISISNNNINFDGTGNYNALDGENGSIDYLFDIKIAPLGDYIDNILGIYYTIQGNYDLTVDGNTFNNVPFSTPTNTEYMYPDKELAYMTTSTTCGSDDHLAGDGQTLCTISMNFLNKNRDPIPLLYYDIDINDNKKTSTTKQETFDLDELTANYETGFVISNHDILTNNNGVGQIQFYSYKPVSNAALIVDLQNLHEYDTDIYDWTSPNSTGGNKVIDQIYFDSVVNIYFSGVKTGGGTSTDEDNIITFVYEKSNANVTDSLGYWLKGEFAGCGSCTFEQGEIISGANFGAKDITITISGLQAPDYLFYHTERYGYKINGNDGIKDVMLKPNLDINGQDLTVILNFFGARVLGLMHKGLNTKMPERMDIQVNIVGGDTGFFTYNNEITNKILKTIRGHMPQTISNPYTLSEIQNIGRDIYECEGDGLITMDNGSDPVQIAGHNQIILVDCPLHIKSDMIYDDDAYLEIYSINQNQNFINYQSPTGWELPSNIYIYPSVKNITANLTTDGSIFTLHDDPGTYNLTSDDIFLAKRYKEENLQKQLYIKGKISSRNTFGGGFRDDADKIFLVGGKSVSANLSIFGHSAEDVAQAYDLNFWRAGFTENELYPLSKISSLIQSKYSCMGDTTIDEDICYRSIVIEYIKRN